MNDSTPASGVWFPHWAEVLARVRLKDLERRSYRLAIVEYLSFCKRSRQRATVASARLFMAQVQERRWPGKSQLAMWKGALNWFFHMASRTPSGGAPGGENLKAETLKAENRAGRPCSGGRILNTEHLTPSGLEPAGWKPALSSPISHPAKSQSSSGCATCSYPMGEGLRAEREKTADRRWNIQHRTGNTSPLTPRASCPARSTRKSPCRRWLIGKGMGENSSRNVQPKLLPVDFRPPLAVIAQSN
jgi:hypothetical protein